MLSTILTDLYPVCGILLVASYLPQVRVVWADRSGARAVSLLAWGFWVMTSAVSSLYAWLVVGDSAFTGVSLGTFLGSSAVLGTAIWRRFTCHNELQSASRPECLVALPSNQT